MAVDPRGATVSKPRRNEEDLLLKLRGLSPEKLAEVEDFVDFLRDRENGAHLSAAASKLSENAFQRIWDNPDDAVYDRL